MIRSNSRLKTKTAVTRIMSAKKTMAEHCLFTSSQWFSSSGCIPSALNGYFSFSDLVWKVNSRLRVDRLSNQCSFTRKISVSWEKNNCRDNWLLCVCFTCFCVPRFIWSSGWKEPEKEWLTFQHLGRRSSSESIDDWNSNECNNALLCVVCSWKKPFSIFLCVIYSKRFLVTFILRVLNVKYVASVLDLILKYWEKWLLSLFFFSLGWWKPSGTA